MRGENMESNRPREEITTGYHPALPAVETAAKDVIFSDHVAIVATIEIEHFGNLKFVSYNVFGEGEKGYDLPFTPNGAKPSALRDNNKLIDSIVAMNTVQNSNLFLAQEIKSTI